MKWKNLFMAGAMTLAIPLVLSVVACQIKTQSQEESSQEDSSVETLPKLGAPTNVRVANDEFVYWNEVPNASSYVVKINDFQESINGALKCSISSIMDAHIEYDTPTALAISVKAKGNQITFLDSDWSEKINYTYTKIEPVDPNKETLPAPNNIRCINNVISWDAVPNAFGYLIYFYDEVDFTANTTETSLDVSRLFTDAVDFSFKIKTIASDHDEYNNSPWSNTIASTIRADGTEEFPYLIPDTIKFYNFFRTGINSEGKYYRITKDFVLNGTDCLEIPSFSGFLDGDNHSVIDIKLGSYDDTFAPMYYGCWIEKNYGTIKNLTFVRPKLDASLTYDSEQETTFRTAIVAENYGTLSHINIKSGVFKSEINEEKTAAGHDASPVLLTASLCSYNNGVIENCYARNTSVKGYSNAENNKGATYSCVGGLVATNDTSGIIRNCLVSDITISSEARGGYYVFLQGGGQVHSWASYFVGNNAGVMNKCVSYNHGDDSLTSKATALADYMGVENYTGLVAGRSTGTYENVYAVRTNNVTNFQGSDTSACSNCVYGTINGVLDTITSWDGWSYNNSELVLE